MWCHMDLADRFSGVQCEAAQKEVLALTVKVLTKVFPDRFQLEGSTLSNVATGEEFDVADTCTNPMDTIARLVQVLLSHSLFIDLLMSFYARCGASCSDMCAVTCTSAALATFCAVNCFALLCSITHSRDLLQCL